MLGAERVCRVLFLSSWMVEGGGGSVYFFVSSTVALFSCWVGK